MIRLLLMLLFSGLFLDHPIHISKTDCFLDVDNNRVQWSQSIFIDDLEIALQEFSDSLFLGTPFEHDSADLFIFKYLTDHISIKIDGRQVPLTFLGKELSEDYAALWIYLEGDLPKKVRKRYELALTNRVLLEVYEDQKNLFNFHDSNDNKFFTSFFLRKSFSTKVMEK